MNTKAAIIRSDNAPPRSKNHGCHFPYGEANTIANGRNGWKADVRVVSSPAAKTPGGPTNEIAVDFDEPAALHVVEEVDEALLSADAFSAVAAGFARIHSKVRRGCKRHCARRGFHG